MLILKTSVLQMRMDGCKPIKNRRNLTLTLASPLPPLYLK